MEALPRGGDPHDLRRFVEAQAPVIEQVFAELRAGRKRTHWMWFVFPQIAGLGSSATAQRYAFASLDEARAYLEHPLLWPRLRDLTTIVDGLPGRSATAVFGTPDDMKFRSSMTLFAAAAQDAEPFRRTLSHYFAGVPDPATLERLG